MNQDAIEQMWSDFATSTQTDATYTAWAFGDGHDPEFATRLARMVIQGPKRATTGLMSDYGPEGHPPAVEGDYSVIVDGDGDPVCIIRTREVRVVAFGDVDDGFAWDEGEGDRSLEWWKQAHRAFFAGAGEVVDDDTPMVLERFDLVWPA